MKITINKDQWEAMGKQAGWMKAKADSRDFLDMYNSVRKPGVRPGQIHRDKRPTGPMEEEPSDLETLKEEANQVALARGHALGDWEYFKRSKGRGANNKCMVCGREVQVLENPLPNEIDVGGEAVALNCA